MPKSRLKTYARVAGVLYLVIIACAGFSQGYVRSTLVVPGDAAMTAANIQASQTLFRLGFVCDLIAFMADAAVAVLLYVLLEPVSRTLSLMAAVFRLIAHPAIAAVNLLNHYGVLLLLGGAGYLSVFQPEQLDALALLNMGMHRYGYLIAGAFFGVHCALLGHLLFRSDLFPKWLGVLLGLAAVGYLTDSLVFFLIPAAGAFGQALVLVTASVAEVALCLWLIVRGVQESEGREDTGRPPAYT